jgi:hypothetical protein
VSVSCLPSQLTRKVKASNQSRLVRRGLFLGDGADGQRTVDRRAPGLDQCADESLRVDPEVRGHGCQVWPEFMRTWSSSWLMVNTASSTSCTGW